MALYINIELFVSGNLRHGEFPRKKILVGKGKCQSVTDFY